MIIHRKWKPGNKVQLIVPMDIRISRWYENSAGIERGPLVYALLIEEKWKEVKTSQWEHSFFEVIPQSPWNYGIYRSSLENKVFEVKETDRIADMPWNLENVPVMLKTKGCRVPEWNMQNHSAGKIPVPSRIPGQQTTEITLIPYGCTTLRISEFPVVYD